MPRKIVSTAPYSITLDKDTTNVGNYEKGGIDTQMKWPTFLSFKPLRDALKDPDVFCLSDWSEFDCLPLLHLAFQALDKFLFELGRFPVNGLEVDAEKLISISTNIDESSRDNKHRDIDPIFFRHSAFGASALLNHMATMIIDIVAQEVMKACSGKFHPFFKFFYFDLIESIPNEPLEPSEFLPLNSRYDEQVSILGSKLRKKLEDARAVVVGSGTLGCEFVKNFALMEVSRNKLGKLIVTDEDEIKKNNLSRQILLQDWNIGYAKYIVATSVVSLAETIKPNKLLFAFNPGGSKVTVEVSRTSILEDKDVNGGSIVVNPAVNKGIPVFLH